MTGLENWLQRQPNRCNAGHDITTQHNPRACPCPGIKAGTDAMSATQAARPLDSRAVETAVRSLAATGKPFSANDARQVHGVRGGVVGATFNALRQEGVIKPVGHETSTDRGTHGKPVALWIGDAA